MDCFQYLLGDSKIFARFSFVQNVSKNSVLSVFGSSKRERERERDLKGKKSIPVDEVKKEEL